MDLHCGFFQAPYCDVEIRGTSERAIPGRDTKLNNIVVAPQDAELKT